jgi:Major Facilitator Superfamily
LPAQVPYCKFLQMPAIRVLVVALYHNKQQALVMLQVPYSKFLKAPAVWAVIVAHFAFNWGYYTLLAWLPSYFDLALELEVSKSSFFTLIPYLSMVVMTPFVGPVADGLIARGWSTTNVRKLCQGVSFVGPCACMLALAALTPAAGAAAAGQVSQTTVWTIVGLMSVAFALSAWSRAGLYCNHQDMSPKCALQRRLVLCRQLRAVCARRLLASEMWTVSIQLVQVLTHTAWHGARRGAWLVSLRLTLTESARTAQHACPAPAGTRRRCSA